MIVISLSVPLDVGGGLGDRLGDCACTEPAASAASSNYETGVALSTNMRMMLTPGTFFFLRGEGEGKMRLMPGG